MKKKKSNKIKELNNTIIILREQLHNSQNDVSEYKRVFANIRTLLEVDFRFNSDDLLLKIVELISYRRYHEGAYHLLKCTINSQTEIIRWSIEPSTAQKTTDEMIKELRDKNML